RRRALFALHRTGFGEPPRRRGAGGLLPHRFTLTADVSGDPSEAVSFLFHFPSAFAAWLAPASCPPVSGLSSTGPHGPTAVTRPARNMVAPLGARPRPRAGSRTRGRRRSRRGRASRT